MSAVIMKAKSSWPEVSVWATISGSGFAVPPRVVPNSHFESYLETSDQWIRDRTGIEERRWVDNETGVTELAEIASREAIKRAGLTVADLDAIVFATVTPDNIFPSSACILQLRLGMQRGFAYDVNAVCSGFLYALTNAQGLIATGQAKHVLVVGADVFSRIIDPRDRSTCVLFGDGAGAVVLSGVETGPRRGSAPVPVLGSSESTRGIYLTELHSDGSYGDILYAQWGSHCGMSPERIGAGEHYVKMEGREVFKLAVRSLCEVSETVLKRVGIDASQVDWFITHQANKRILDTMAKYLGVPEEKVLTNVAHYGNTSAASVPILLAESELSGKLKKGDLVLLSAFGGGITWGATLLRW